MKLKASESEYAIAPTGTHNAVLTQCVDQGTVEVGGQFPGPKRIVRLAWEIDEPMDDGRRFQVYARYTLSFHEKAKLRQMLEAWRGKKFSDGEEFDLEDIVGKPCMVTIQHSPDGKWANVVGVSPVTKGLTPLKPNGDVLMFSFDDANYLDKFSKLPEYMQEKLAQAPEFNRAAENQQTQQQREPAQPMRDDFDDEIPF